MMTSKKSRFSLPRDITYLNCSYMSPLLKEAEKVGIRSIRQRRNPSAVKPEDFFNESNELRTAFAQTINATESNRIVIVPSASYGLASVAKNVRAGKGDHIIVAGGQFPSNYYPWQRLSIDTGAVIRTVEPPEALQDRGKIWNERLLDAIDSSTRLVALGNVHWADGTLFNLREIRKRTRDVGALLIIDGTQSVGALPFDLQQIQPDALVCAGYKWLMGPYSIGLAWYGEQFDNGIPIEESWMNRLNSENFSALLNYNPEYQPGALRYEVGEHSNFNLVPMLKWSIQQINKWGIQNIQNYCRDISASAIESLRASGYWIEDDAYRGAHLFGIRLNGKDIVQVKERLAKNKIFVSFRGDAIRVSPNVYNTHDDMARLARVLNRLK